MRKINASQFKTHCLALLDEVLETGEQLIVLKRGKPVARVVPPAPEEPKYPQDRLHGSGKVLDDLTKPVLNPDTWDAARGVWEPETS